MSLLSWTMTQEQIPPKSLISKKVHESWCPHGPPFVWGPATLL